MNKNCVLSSDKYSISLSKYKLILNNYGITIFEYIKKSYPF